MPRPGNTRYQSDAGARADRFLTGTTSIGGQGSTNQFSGPFPWESGGDKPASITADSRPGGRNGVFCDGTVCFLKDSINARTWSAIVGSESPSDRKASRRHASTTTRRNASDAPCRPVLILKREGSLGLRYLPPGGRLQGGGPPTRGPRVVVGERSRWGTSPSITGNDFKCNQHPRGHPRLILRPAIPRLTPPGQRRLRGL